jgi:hypothetical protein
MLRTCFHELEISQIRTSIRIQYLSKLTSIGANKKHAIPQSQPSKTAILSGSGGLIQTTMHDQPGVVSPSLVVL